jgi:hypothetical protein
MARLEPVFVDHLSESDLDALIGIGRRQALLLDQLQAALEAGNDAHALQLARQLVKVEIKLS